MNTPQTIYLVKLGYNEYAFTDYKEARAFFEAMQTAQLVDYDYEHKVYLRAQRGDDLEMRRITNREIVDSLPEPATEEAIA